MEVDIKVRRGETIFLQALDSQRVEHPTVSSPSIQSERQDPILSELESNAKGL